MLVRRRLLFLYRFATFGTSFRFGGTYIIRIGWRADRAILEKYSEPGTQNSEAVEDKKVRRLGALEHLLPAKAERSCGRRLSRHRGWCRRRERSPRSFRMENLAPAW